MFWAPSLLLPRAGRWLWETTLSLLYPPHCAHCQAETEAGAHLCVRCAGEAQRLTAPFCRTCSEPFEGAITGSFRCANCSGRRFHFRCVVAPYRARKVVREFIHRFKYNRHYYLRHQLADWMAEGLADPRLQQPPVDALVPVPLHAARERHREFNQAAVLAELVSERSGLPVLSALRRVRFTSTQVRLTREQRMENLRGAFAVRQNTPVQHRHLLLLDDVMTTGSTVQECARVLCAAGAASVRVLTVARA